MSKKKSDEPEESAENQELVRRVDAMMSTELPEEAAPKVPPKRPKTKDDADVTKLEPPADPPIVITLADENKSPEPPEPSDPPQEPAADSDTKSGEPSEDQTQDPLEDSATDEAVDDIVAHEGDTVLAVNDALTARKQATAQPGQPSGPRSSHKWLLIIILIILLGTAADVAIYLTR